MGAEKLFVGDPHAFGGLSNERELVEICPSEFRTSNPWSQLAHRIFFLGANASNWQWKSLNESERRLQRACFMSLLGTFALNDADKIAVAGWMLSQMLTEVPDHIPSSGRS